MNIIYTVLGLIGTAAVVIVGLVSYAVSGDQRPPPPGAGNGR